MSLAKLTSVSTQTLSLLLERQRLSTLSSPGTSSNLHLTQISRNLRQLRSGILELETREGRSSEAAALLRSQYERMRGMLPTDVQSDLGIESMEKPVELDDTAPSSSTPTLIPPQRDAEPVYSPYTDDPEAQYEPGQLLQTQRQMMDEQDTHLDHLSHSINRQHHVSLQINDELDVHTGLLEELDTDLDRTGGRLSAARKKLDKVAHGMKNNGSTVTIAVLILVLLILIIVFKT
ncbi:hypothetical protein PLICRDRAFT_44600 [Plicaturopsis crispa FD-325 SS-3]|nr:hypothetical protein PLICRDRAFT_44600 [Plicaturopsis crispa FD-325 SS-3]